MSVQSAPSVAITATEPVTEKVTGLRPRLGPFEREARSSGSVLVSADFSADFSTDLTLRGSGHTDAPNP